MCGWSRMATKTTEGAPWRRGGRPRRRVAVPCRAAFTAPSHVRRRHELGCNRRGATQLLVPLMCDGAQLRSPNETMRRTVFLLVACTSRKRVRPAEALCLRSVRSAPVSRAEAWLARLQEAEKTTKVGQLYSGDSWHVARRLVSGLGDEAQLWALSAGVGLVMSDDRIAPYSATFSSGHPDSVHRPGDPRGPRLAKRAWWWALSTWGDVTGHRPRSISALAGSEPPGSIVVCAGADYVDALADDLLRARELLDSPERMLIFGAGSCRVPELQDSWISLPAKLRSAVGGSLGSLSIRSAERVLREWSCGGVEVMPARRAIAHMSDKLEELPNPQRRRLPDDQVVEWIVTAVQRHPGLTKTAALRQFRDGGLACEQTRFANLFAEVQDALP